MGEDLMSRQQERIDPNVLLMQIQAIRDQINRIQGFIAELATARENVIRSIDSIKALNKTSDDNVILPLDPQMNSLTVLKPVDVDHVIVHLGLNVYARLSFSDAIKVLEAKENRLSKSISEATRQLNELVKLHDQYQTLLQSIALSAQAQQSRSKT